MPFNGAWPTIHETAFVAPGAVVIGNVTLGEESSVWFNTTVRGDIAPISIGARTSIQDGTVVHVNMDAPTTIGDDVVVGHSALVHGAVVRDRAMIGMGSLVLSYSDIGQGAVIAAGALIPERSIVAPGAVMMGVPAREKTTLSQDQQQRLAGIPARYVRVSRQYLANMHAPGGEDDAH